MPNCPRSATLEVVIQFAHAMSRMVSRKFSALIFILVLLVSSAAAQQRRTPLPEPQKESRISPADAQELLRSVDSILQFDSKDTELPIRNPIKRQLASRAMVQTYVEDHMKKDEDAQRLQRAEAILKKFGLLPRDFELQPFLVDLLREQVAGYYDPETKTVYVLDWVEPEIQQPVLAHELTHALQDQNYGLESWTRDGSGKKRKHRSGQDEADYDEQLAARHAVIEGQGMAVMIDFLLAPSGKNITTAPEIAEAIQAGMLSAPTSPVLRRAPLYIKESLMFPYKYGLDFIRDLLALRGKEQAYAGLFQKPPLNTRQIMEPATYLAGERIEPMRLPNFDSLLGKQYKRYDTGAIGEFDVAVLLKQYAGTHASSVLSRQWRGGYYYAALPSHKAQPPPETGSNSDAEPAPASVAIIYVSQWASADDAAKFAGIYASYLSHRYASVKPPLPAAPRSDLSSVAWPAPPLTQSGRWMTEEGAVVIEPRGSTLLITEGLDDATAAKLREAVFAPVKKK